MSIGERLRNLETQETIIVDTVVGLAANWPPGIITRLAYASDGRKTGEAPGAGTGVLAYDDSIAWRRVDDGTTVLA